MGRMPKFKPDENGRPTLKAAYIMKRDPGARAAYDAIRRRGVSVKDAEHMIEQAFRGTFLVKLRYDRELPLTQLFPALPGFPDRPPKQRTN